MVVFKRYSIRSSGSLFLLSTDLELHDPVTGVHVPLASIVAFQSLEQSGEQGSR